MNTDNIAGMGIVFLSLWGTMWSSKLTAEIGVIMIVNIFFIALFTLGVCLTYMDLKEI